MTDPIDPHRVYTPIEAAKVMRVGRDVVYREIKVNKIDDTKGISHRKIGNGYKILGENMLAFLGSATFADQKTRTRYTGGVADE